MSGVMNKPSTVPALPIRARDGRTQPAWADAEARGFMERPACPVPFAKVLRVIIIAAMATAVVKVAWILAFHMR
jgi:hypothetical protein